MLIEAIEPGTPLVVCSTYPPLEHVSGLLCALHESGVPDPAYPAVEQRVEYLFTASLELYQRHPELAAVISPEFYERGHRFASRLARDPAPAVLLHGDLTPSNILDGGADRGLVAIDPAPCRGDAAFDAVDLIFWQADGLRTIEARIEQLAGPGGIEAARLCKWCVAFAGMAALELARLRRRSQAPIDALHELASQAPAA